MEQKFFICEHCGNIIAMVKDAGVPIMCCGQKMKEIVPGTTDAAVEKHVPVYTVEGTGRFHGTSYAAGALYCMGIPADQAGKSAQGAAAGQ